MVLLALGAAIVVSAVLCRAIRRVLVTALVVLGILIVISHIPSSNRSLASFRLLLSLLGHLIWVSIKHGARAYARLAESWLRKLHA
ncbi:MAG: hypothetical protein OWU84_03975 [Firmicutes bacterium]|nr:hypothetical protein [Bacillota bacterium]